MTLEDDITDGLISYIKCIRHDEAKATLTLEFVKDPEDQVVDRVLVFSGVCELYQEIHDGDDDEDCLESLIGLDEYKASERTRYVVATDAREVGFYTEEPPVIKRIPE